MLLTMHETWLKLAPLLSVNKLYRATSQKSETSLWHAVAYCLPFAVSLILNHSNISVYKRHDILIVNIVKKKERKI